MVTVVVAMVIVVVAAEEEAVAVATSSGRNLVIRAPPIKVTTVRVASLVSTTGRAPMASSHRMPVRATPLRGPPPLRYVFHFILYTQTHIS